MVLAAAIGVLAVAVGLAVSYHLESDASATVALIPIVPFFAVLATSSRRSGSRRE